MLFDLTPQDSHSMLCFTGKNLDSKSPINAFHPASFHSNGVGSQSKPKRQRVIDKDFTFEIVANGQKEEGRDGE